MASKSKRSKHAPRADSPPVAERTPPPSPIPTTGLVNERFLVGGGAFLICVVVYWWVISAGTFSHWPSYSGRPGFYVQLAEAFLHGQTHLLQQPDPAWLALPDPLEPTANFHFRYGDFLQTGQNNHHDMLWVDGKFYLYWGPVPAIVLAPVVWVTGWSIGDEELTFWFTVGLALASIWLVSQIQQRLYARQSLWIFFAACLCVGLSHPVTFLLARSSVYEVAIVSAQFFFVLGLGCLFHGLAHNSFRPAWMAGAGAALGASVGCRISLLFAVAAIGLFVLWRVMRQMPAFSQRQRGSLILAFGTPVLLTGALLATYNQVRFGSPTEFGLRYQLSSLYMPEMHDKLFSPRFIPHAIGEYVFCPQVMLPVFPYLFPRNGTSAAGAPPLNLAPEFVTGWVFGAPVVLLVLSFLGLLAARRWRLPVLAALQGDRSALVPDDQRLEGWLGLLLLGSFLLAMYLPFCMPLSTMRYQMDGNAALMILAALGIWNLPAALGRVRIPLLSLLVAATVLNSLLLSMIGPYAHFDKYNPALMRSLRGQ